MTYKFDFYRGSIIVVPKISSVSDTSEIKFMLDTGASKTVIDSTAATKRLGFDLKNLEAGDRLMTANGRINSKKLELPKFKLFGKELVNFEVSVFELPLQITYFADGLLGMDFLLQFKKITFDFDKKTIETSQQQQ